MADMKELSTIFPDISVSAVKSVWNVIWPFLKGYLNRKNTKDQEFDKAKAEIFKDVLHPLLESGEMTYVELYKAKNFLSIAEKADNYYRKLKQDDELESERYDLDWFVRFYEESGEVSNESMQDIWAKILAGEIHHPGAYSLLTINVLRNLRQRDAELFMKVLKYSVSGKTPFIPNYEDYLRHCEIAYNDILYLGEIGLINNLNSIGKSIDLEKSGAGTILAVSENYAIVARPSATVTSISILAYPLTIVGTELASLQSVSIPDEDFIYLGKVIKQQNHNVQISLYKIIEVCGENLELDSDDLLI